MGSDRPSPTPSQAAIGLTGLRVPVRLGWEKAERATPQVVSIDLTIQFDRLPEACTTDQISGTIDYAALATRIAAHCAAGEFRLLERLGKELYDLIHPELPQGAGLHLTITKTNPIPGLPGNSRFTIGDPRA